MVKCKFYILLPSDVFWSILWKMGISKRKEYNVATWNCHIYSYNRNSRLNNYNWSSHVHNALQKILPAWLQETPMCTVSIKIVTHIFDAETFTCINATEISNCIIATETVIYITATKKSTNTIVAEGTTCITATDIGACIIAIESVSCLVPTETATCRTD